MLKTRIPDSILPKLRCHCGQYLSKRPITIQDGRLVCSSCTKMCAPLPVEVSNNSPYEAIASLHLFPCPFKLQGCQLSVKFEEMGYHETVCAYRIHNCPFSLHSSCIWKGPVSELYEHYKNEHPHLLIESPNFPIDMVRNYEEYRLIRIKNDLLLLQVKCSVEKGMLWFNMVCFGAAEDASLINYTVSLCGITSKIAITLTKAHAMPITGMHMVPAESNVMDIANMIAVLQDPNVECHWVVDVTEEFKDKMECQQKIEDGQLYEMQKKIVKCPNCSIYMVPPIYRCDQGHATCVECKGYHKNCKICGRHPLVEAADLEEIAKRGQYQCRWLNCSGSFTYKNIREHEQSCPSRIYKCPKCLAWTGLGKDIKDHFKIFHPYVTISFNNSTTIEIQEKVPGYIFAYGEFFMYEFTNSFRNTDFYLYYLGLPSLVESWEYKISEQLLNLCNLSKKARNLYFGRMPRTNSGHLLEQKCELCISKKTNE